MSDVLDASLPSDRDLASTWPALMRETRALFNAFVQGAVTFTDPGTGTRFQMKPRITGQDDQGNNIYAIDFVVVP